jgi:hypothetical protein
MDKLAFVTILEAALLNFEGIEESEIIEKYGLDAKLTKVGVQLCSYLKSKEV